MDRDMVNIIHYLYHHGTIEDEQTKRILNCIADTIQPLERVGVLTETKNGIELAPSVMGFLKLAEENLRTFPVTDWVFAHCLSDPPGDANAPRRCFVAMPYGLSWFQRVKATLTAAAEQAGYETEISSDVARAGAIVGQVWGGLRKADAVVADVTGNNANVFYELGLAHALGKEVVLITQDEKALPFDVQSLRCIPYRLSDLSRLESRLRDSLNEVPPRY